MNYKRGYPRTAARNYTAQIRFPDGAPRWWDVLFHRRPARRRDTQLLRRIMQGADPDGIVWELGTHKPHNYYW